MDLNAFCVFASLKLQRSGPKNNQDPKTPPCIALTSGWVAFFRPCFIYYYGFVSADMNSKQK